MFKKEALTVLFVFLFALVSLGFVFYSETSITGAVTGFAAKSFLDSANEAVQGLVKTSKDVIIDNPLRVSKSVEDIFELQISEGKELPPGERTSFVLPPAEWCGRNWREREECTRTGGNLTGRVAVVNGKPEYFCSCDCVTLLGGKNESLVSNRKCACKNPNLEILGTPPRCQTKCSNTGGRHENNDPTKPCVCPSGTAYIQNAGCTKMIFQNQTSTPVVKNVSATLTPTSTATPQPVSTLTPQTTKTPTLSPAQTSTPTSTPQTADYRPQTYLPIITPTPKREEYSPLVPSRAVPTQIPQPVQIIKQVAQQIVPLQNTPSTAMQPIVKSIPQKLSDEQCKSLLNNFAKQQYDSFLKSWPQINLMAQQANFKGQFERMRNQLEHSLKTFVEYEAEQKKCDDDLAEDIVDSWLANFDSSFKKFAEEKKEQIKGRGLGRK